MSIEPFPELHELIALFEAEPVITDPEMPPEYNCLTFKATVGEDTITCAIEPGYETLWLGWKQAGRELLVLSLEQVRRIAVERSVERELLVVSFHVPGLANLILRLRPSVHIYWSLKADAEAA